MPYWGWSLIDKKLTQFIIIKLNSSMCFISHACPQTKPLMPQDLLTKSETPFFEEDMVVPKCHPLQFCPPFQAPAYFMTKEQQIWANLLASISYNSSLLLKLGQNVDFSSRVLDEANQKAQKELGNATESASSEPKGWRAKQQIVEKLFGQRDYKYRLKLRHKLPSTIYKGRNLSLNLELLDREDKLVLNSNLINLCVASTDLEGNWIQQNEEGEYFMQGKTEVELYHGESSFQKIYPRDVSRQFEHGKVNMVIYAKPSLIQFSSSANTLESTVKSEQIEPLLIKDITIRAKKKSQ